MQLCAYDLNQKLLFAHNAIKQSDYRCIECGQIIRLRSGMYRQPHFYHVQPNTACRLNGKGIEHLMVQNYLKDSLPDGEAVLEHRFPEISRIADVVWRNQKVIFEVQCSPITAQEIKERNQDYASIGYDVIWIFHDKRYNQKRVTAAEHSQRRHPHYYTNINSDGVGCVYDQPALYEQGFRTHRLPFLVVEPMRIMRIKGNPTISLPRLIQERLNHWKLHLKGDYSTECTKDRLKENLVAILYECRQQERGTNDPNNMTKMDKEQIFALPILRALQLLWRWWIVRPYLATLRLLLERSYR